MTSNAISSLLLQCYNVASASRLICLLLLMTDKHADATMSYLSRQVLLAVTLFVILHAVALLHWVAGDLSSQGLLATLRWEGNWLINSKLLLATKGTVLATAATLITTLLLCLLQCYFGCYSCYFGCYNAILVATVTTLVATATTLFTTLLFWLLQFLLRLLQCYYGYYSCYFCYYNDILVATVARRATTAR